MQQRNYIAQVDIMFLHGHADLIIRFRLSQYTISEQSENYELQLVYFLIWTCYVSFRFFRLVGILSQFVQRTLNLCASFTQCINVIRMS